MAFLQNGVVHPDLQKLCDLFPQIMYAGQRTEIPGGFQPELLLPGKHYLHSLHVQSFASQGSDIGAESR